MHVLWSPVLPEEESKHLQNTSLSLILSLFFDLLLTNAFMHLDACIFYVVVVMPSFKV